VQVLAPYWRELLTELDAMTPRQAMLFPIGPIDPRTMYPHSKWTPRPLDPRPGAMNYAAYPPDDPLDGFPLWAGFAWLP
jgi:hypothetical protein